jgi:hypothetical protein
MAEHARQLASPENLRRASLDPRLSGLHQPLRAGDPREMIGSIPGPAVYIHVDSVEDGTLWVDSVAEGSPTEAWAIAWAVADAYVADQGPNRIAPGTAGISTACQFWPAPLGEPWELATALTLAALASIAVLILPLAWVTKRRLAMAAVAVPTASVFVLEEWHFFPPGGPPDIVAAAIASAAFGVGAARRPWLFLALALLVYATAPVVHDGFNAASLSAGACILAWLIGAPAGWVSRRLAKRKPTPDADRHGAGTTASLTPSALDERAFSLEGEGGRRPDEGG